MDLRGRSANDQRMKVIYRVIASPLQAGVAFSIFSGFLLMQSD